MHLNRFALTTVISLVALPCVQAQTHQHTTMDHQKHMATMAEAQRQAEVAQRGTHVMPFSLQVTQHIFTKSPSGGTQRVVARRANDAAQVALVRQHLQEIRTQFSQADFSGPLHIHGANMPGLAQLQASKPGQIHITYQEVSSGAELRYTTAEPALVQALHQWFDAQLSDHGADAKAGQMDHSPHRMGGVQKP